MTTETMSAQALADDGVLHTVFRIEDGARDGLHSAACTCGWEGGRGNSYAHVLDAIRAHVQDVAPDDATALTGDDWEGVSVDDISRTFPY